MLSYSWHTIAVPLLEYQISLGVEANKCYPTPAQWDHESDKPFILHPSPLFSYICFRTTPFEKETHLTKFCNISMANLQTFGGLINFCVSQVIINTHTHIHHWTTYSFHIYYSIQPSGKIVFCGRSIVSGNINTKYQEKIACWRTRILKRVPRIHEWRASLLGNSISFDEIGKTNQKHSEKPLECDEPLVAPHKERILLV